MGASDIHISTDEKPIFRVSGSMKIQEKYPVLDLETARHLVEQGMEDENKKIFDDEKDLDFAIEIPEVSRFRVNTFFTTKGVNAVFRIIPNEIKTIDDLNLPTNLRDILKLKKGLVIVTGPTGSGKSTTLAAIINEYNEKKRGNVITIEDPVEFVHKPIKSIVSHREVGKHTKSFANALRGATRQDPDIILVGEMRDLETILLALTAAETGILVFGTLHTSSAAKTINRIIDVFPAEQQNQIRSVLADSVEYIIAQNLLKKIGGGRVAALEILIGTDGIRNQIRKGEIHQIEHSIQGGKDIGMQNLSGVLNQLVKDRVVTLDEARKNAVNPDEINDPLGEMDEKNINLADNLHIS